MANPYLVDQLDTSAPGLPPKVLRAQQRKKDEEKRVRDTKEQEHAHHTVLGVQIRQLFFLIFPRHPHRIKPL